MACLGQPIAQMDLHLLRHAPGEVEFWSGKCRTCSAHEVVPDIHLSEAEEVVHDVEPLLAAYLEGPRPFVSDELPRWLRLKSRCILKGTYHSLVPFPRFILLQGKQTHPQGPLPDAHHVLLIKQSEGNGVCIRIRRGLELECREELLRQGNWHLCIAVIQQPLKSYGPDIPQELLLRLYPLHCLQIVTLPGLYQLSTSSSLLVGLRSLRSSDSAIASRSFFVTHTSVLSYAGSSSCSLPSSSSVLLSAPGPSNSFTKGTWIFSVTGSWITRLEETCLCFFGGALASNFPFLLRSAASCFSSARRKSSSVPWSPSASEMTASVFPNSSLLQHFTPPNSPSGCPIINGRLFLRRFAHQIHNHLLKFFFFLVAISDLLFFLMRNLFLEINKGFPLSIIINRGLPLQFFTRGFPLNILHNRGFPLQTSKSTRGLSLFLTNRGFPLRYTNNRGFPLKIFSGGFPLNILCITNINVYY